MGSTAKAVTALCLAVGVLLFIAAPAPGQDAEVVDLGEDPEVKQLSDWINAAETDSDKRRAAADKLIEYVVDRERGAIQAVAYLLDRGRQLHARRSVLMAVSRSDDALDVTLLAEALLTMRTSLPSELEDQWVRTLGRFELEQIADGLAEAGADGQAPLDERRLAIRALGEHRRLFAVEKLMELTSVNQLKQVQGWAYDALAELSHQDALGKDRAAWGDWYNQARDLSAAQWQRMLHENLLSQVRGQAQTEDRVRDRLIATQRALYRATALEQRPALLIELLDDPLDDVRILAMDLARQWAEDNGEFGPELRKQLRAKLTDRLPRVREESATLLGTLLDADAADTMAKRLAEGEEGVATVEEAYLVALSRMPRAEALQAGYEKLENPALEAASAGMLAAAHRAELGDEAFWEGVRERVRKRLEGVTTTWPQMVTLLGLVIEEDDTKSWERIGGWLNAKDDRVREAAARVWAGSSRSLVVLAERCDDPVIRPIALKAIAERGNKNASLKAVAARRPTDPEDIRLWEEALTALAARVTQAELLDVISNLADRNGETRHVREKMLTAAIDREDRPDPPTRDALRLLIARGEVRVLDDTPALVVLDFEAALEHADKLTDELTDRARRGLARAYLADDRLDDALKTAGLVLKPEGKLIPTAGADPLLETLIGGAGKAIQQGRKEDAGKILIGIRTLLAEAVSAELDATLLKLEAQLKPAEPEEPAP